MSDSEILTLVLCAQWHGQSERHDLDFVATYWHAYFPRLLDQSQFNRRARDLDGALVRLGPMLADAVGGAAAAYAVLDTVAVPRARRCRGRRHKLFGTEAGFGRGGSDRDRYYGCALLAAVRPDGCISGWRLGPANTEDRWLADALRCWRVDSMAAPWTPADLPTSQRKGGGSVGPTGPIGPVAAVGAPITEPYLTDAGFRGAAWIEHWRTDYEASVLTTKSYLPGSDPAARRQHSGRRQIVESVFSVLTGALQLSFPGAHTLWGPRTRIAAKLAAFNLGRLLTYRLGRPPFAIASLCPV